jgi:hypothetical protein
LTPFRDEASERGIPSEDVENWSTLTGPCATVTQNGEGPVVGRFGGPLLLPADVPDPAFPFVATIDLATLPAGRTDLPLPADGQLLLFACPEDEEAVHTDPLEGVVYRAVRTEAAGEWDGPVSGDVADRVLLADWYAGVDVTDWESAAVHWGIQRGDLAAGRLDRAFAQVCYNP